MEIDAILKAAVAQQNKSVGSDGTERGLDITRRGQIATTNWKHELVLAGMVYRMSIGTITAGGDITLIQGGGAGTTIDLDQPEGVVAVDSGWLIPIAFEFSAQVDMDADAEVGNVVVTADRSQATAAGATATVETPDNLLDGGAAFAGRAYSAVTADVTDPIHSDILYYKTIRAAEFISNGTATNLTNGIVAEFSASKEWDLPTLLAGPCQLLVYWGGTAAVNAIASLVFAHVQSSAVYS